MGAGAYGVYRHLNYSDDVTSKEFQFEEGQEKNQAEAGASSGIAIPGYSTIYLDAGTTDAEVNLTNPEGNDVYFEISFYLPKTDETIYTSKLLAPGQNLYDISLDKPLEAGEYDLTVIYTTYAMDENYTPMNGAEVNCKLVVSE
ncbi:MAG: hypothetical protein IJ675_06470 [Pseudobutyrivibrio sp.]|nr:hypothetical protein [Pseudobutyrivibrio sp.]